MIKGFFKLNSVANGIMPHAEILEIFARKFSMVIPDLKSRALNLPGFQENHGLRLMDPVVCWELVKEMVYGMIVLSVAILLFIFMTVNSHHMTQPYDGTMVKFYDGSAMVSYS